MTPPSIVLVESLQKDNTAFGTGFVVARDGDVTYVVTCAHVVRDVGGPDNVKVAARHARVVALGEDNGLDLAVLESRHLQSRSPLSLREGGTRGLAVEIEGYYKYISLRPLEAVRGRLGGSFRLSDTQHQHYIQAWHIDIDDKEKLLGGYSGSPVCDAESGAVLGVVMTRDGEQQGRAISIAALPIVWPNMPSGMIAPTFTAENKAERAQAAAGIPESAAPVSPPTRLEGLIDFGSGNTIGNVTIGDVAGRDITKLVTSFYASGGPLMDSVEVYLAAHPKLRGVAKGNAGEVVINWANVFKGDDPQEPLWRAQLFPGLEGYLDQFRGERKQRIRLRAFARNSALLAFGYVFCQRARFQIECADMNDTVWRTDEPNPSSVSPLTRTTTNLNTQGRDLILELAMTQGSTKVTDPVDEWLRGEAARAVELSAPDQPFAATTRQLLNSYFSDGELRDLCFDLGIDYESLPGSGKSDKARELLAYVTRRNRIAELLETCRQQRSQVAWPSPSQQDITAQQTPAAVRKRILLALEPGPRTVTPAEGAAIARQVCDLVSGEGRAGGTVHLFGAMPMGVPLLVGWGLKAGHKVQFYDLDAAQRYRPTCLLEG